MNAIVDQLLVGAIILAALLYFVLRTLRQKKGGCEMGCGCSKSKAAKDRKLD